MDQHVVSRSSGSGAGEREALGAFRDRANGPAGLVGEWTTRIDLKQLVLLDVGYVVHNVLPP